MIGKLLCMFCSHRYQPLGRYSAFGFSVVLRCSRCGHERVV